MADANVIKTFCPNCGTVYELDSSSIGQSATCGVCNTEFEVQDQTEYIEQTLNTPGNAAVAEETSPAPVMPEEAAPAAEETPAAPVLPEEAAPAAEETPAVEKRSENDDAVKMEPKTEVQTSTVKLTRVKPAAPAPMRPAFDFQKPVSSAHFAGRKISSGGAGNSRVSSVKKSFWQKLCFWKK